MNFLGILIVGILFFTGIWLLFSKKPITKSTIIKEVKHHYIKGHNTSLCALFYRVLDKYNVKYDIISDVFPLFTYEMAELYGSAVEDYKPFWWDPKNGEARIKFLNWLYSQYAYDLKDLRNTRNKI